MACLSASTSQALGAQRQRQPAFRPARVPARHLKQVRCNAEADGAAKPIEKSGPNFAAAKDIDAIMKTLPHR